MTLLMTFRACDLGDLMKIIVGAVAMTENKITLKNCTCMWVSAVTMVNQ